MFKTWNLTRNVSLMKFASSANKTMISFRSMTTEASSSTDRMTRRTSFPEISRLGGSTIHAHYDYLDDTFRTPPFLKEPRKVGVIGAPMSYGQPRAGTDQGPKMIRERGLEDAVLGLEWRIEDHGDLQFEEPSHTDIKMDPKFGKAKNAHCVGKAMKKIYDKVHDVVNNKEFALVLGGDHSVSIGSVAAVLSARPDTGIVWVDAHGDINTPAMSPSGNIHGMPLGLLMKLFDTNTMPGFEWMNDVPRLRPEQVVYIGLRDLDSDERKMIKKMRIKAFTMQHVDKFGIGDVVAQTLRHLTLPDGNLRPLHLSYDVDAVDPEFAPSTGTVVRGGLSFREAHYVAEAVSETNMLGSMDMVEVNPKLRPGPEAEMTAQMGMALISSALGSRIL